MDLRGRQRGYEVRQGDIDVGLALGFTGGAGEVSPADTGEEAGKRAVVQQIARVLPLVVAPRDQLVERPAAPAGREDELLKQCTRAGARLPCWSKQPTKWQKTAPRGLARWHRGQSWTFAFI